MNDTRKAAARFLVVGALTVAIDLAFYRLLMVVGLSTVVAKTIGFIAGTVFAYVANRTWTFNAESAASLREAGKFAAVYGGSLLANVAVNSGVLALVGRSEPALAAAFLVATGISATLNFLGMKFLVFRPASA